jgi:predicted metal-dependent phosphoesterase TrpH
MMKFKGIIHVHSNYSYDGRHSLEEIARHGRGRGYSFIGMSDHSDTLNEEKMAQQVKDCEKATTSDCLIIPGIEFTCENDLHLLGLGVRHYTDTKDPAKVSEFIRQQGGIAAIAHPSRYNFQISPNLADILHGIEVWNARYDGRFVPNDRSLNLLKEFRSRNKNLLAFGGQDLHWMTDHHYVEITVFCDELTENKILGALKDGNFLISGHFFRVNPKGGLGRWKIRQIGAARRLYRLAKFVRDRLFAEKRNESL